MAFWGNDPTHPSTHVAIVIESGMGNGRIHVLAQNVDASMAARDMWDTAATDGYLRPKTNINKTGELTMNDVQKSPVPYGHTCTTVEPQYTTTNTSHTTEYKTLARKSQNSKPC